MTMVVFQIVGLAAAHNAAKAAQDLLGEIVTNLGIAEPSDGGPIVGHFLTPIKPTLLRVPYPEACNKWSLMVFPHIKPLEVDLSAGHD